MCCRGEQLVRGSTSTCTRMPNNLKLCMYLDAVRSGRCDGVRVQEDGLPVEGVELPSPRQPRGLQDILVESNTKMQRCFSVEEHDLRSACTP